VANWRIIAHVRHFYHRCEFFLDKIFTPLVLPALYLPNAPETVRDISARGSQHVDEEVGGWGRCLASSVSR
jgi:hypothetical protein